MTKSTITRERLEKIKSWREIYGAGSNVILPAEEAEELARMALAAMNSEPVAWTDEEELRDANESGSGYLFGIERDANKFADPRRQIILYRHAQTAPKDHQIRELVNQLRDIAIKYHAAGQLREQIARAVRSSMLQAEPVTTANKLPELIEGMEVSIDVSTCDADAGNRYFGTVAELSELDGAKNGYILLVQDAKPNFNQSSNSPVIPDGYVMVPKEPTEKMVVEGFESWPDEFFSDAEVWEAYDAMSGCQQAAHRAKLCWVAMIAAAPKV